MQKVREKSGVVAGILLPMGLICLFAFCSLALALLGGRAYKQIQAGVDDSYGSTVAASYLRTKLTQSGSSENLSLREEGGVQLLVLASESADVQYETRIYLKDGYLYENFERADTVFEPVGGMQIAAVQSCHFELSDDGLFTAEIVSPAGQATRTSFAVAKGGAV